MSIHHTLEPDLKSARIFCVNPQLQIHPEGNLEKIDFQGNAALHGCRPQLALLFQYSTSFEPAPCEERFAPRTAKETSHIIHQAQTVCEKKIKIISVGFTMEGLKQQVLDLLAQYDPKVVAAAGILVG